MFKKTKIALAAVLLAGTATAASAQAFASNVHEFQSAPARLRSDGAFVPDANQVLEENNWIATNVTDRASSPYAGGGGK
jgi:outer membrane murein-binding lipoprotein Lpp